MTSPVVRSEVPIVGIPKTQYLTASRDPSDVARQCLQASSYACVRRLRCTYHEGVVMLHGRVSSFHLKQIAQEAVRYLGGVEVIVNRIEVVECLRD